MDAILTNGSTDSDSGGGVVAVVGEVFAARGSGVMKSEEVAVGALHAMPGAVVWSGDEE